MNLMLDIFVRKFKDFSDQYVIIGGTATSLLLEQQGLSLVRTTKDIDMVIVAEKLSADFGHAFWDFIKEGKYKVSKRSDGKPQFFRFSKPENENYPAMLELFSSGNEGLDMKFAGTIAPMHLSEDLSSLSAILLNDDYYSFLKRGRMLIEGLSVLSATHLIPLKARAFLDLSARRERGERVDSFDISKHKNDIFRLAQLLSGREGINIPEAIKADMSDFLKKMDNEDIRMRNIGVMADKTSIIKLLRGLYL